MYEYEFEIMACIIGALYLFIIYMSVICLKYKKRIKDLEILLIAAPFVAPIMKMLGMVEKEEKETKKETSKIE